MKQLYCWFCLVLWMVTTYAQSAGKKSPAHWSYTALKVNDTTWAIHLTAVLDEGWHVYSQTQPSTAVAQPTAIVFIKNPLLKLKGKAKETGKMEHFKDEASGIEASQYTGAVDFIQTIVKKARVKTVLTGTVTFQTCTDEMCLPPKTENFSIALE